MFKRVLAATMLLFLPLSAADAATFNVSPGSGIIDLTGDLTQPLYGQVTSCQGSGMKFAIGGTIFDCAEKSKPFDTGAFSASDWFPDDASGLGFFSEFSGVSANWRGELDGNVGTPFAAAVEGGTLAQYGVGFGSNGTGSVIFRAEPFSDTEPPTTSPIPLPAAVWMLVAALGGLGTVGAFRRKGAG